MLIEQALGEFYEKHARDVWTYAYRVTGNAADADDIVQELRIPARTHASAAPAAPPPAGREDPLLAALGHDPVTLDALSARLGWPTAELQARLLEMELDGRLARLPGGLFQRREQG